MTAKIITIAQQKGGAGKTTLAIHLATAWQAMGKHVCVVDIDPQASVTAWDEFRHERWGDDMPGPDVKTVTGWRISGEVNRLRRDYDVIVIDSPPHVETEARIAIRAADLVVVPLQPSPVDLWATRGILELAEKEGVPTLMVLNRARNTKLTEKIKTMLGDTNTHLAKTTIGNRVDFAASLLEGRGIVEKSPKSMASSEIQELAKEIMRATSRNTAQAA